METISRFIETPTQGRFVVANAAAGRPLLAGFHGYGENADIHLGQLLEIPGTDEWIVAAVQGLHWFYRGRSEEVVASWMTHLGREHAIRQNIAYARSVLDALRSDFAAGEPVVLAGFSQGVSMAWRTALHGGVAIGGLILLGSDMPPEVAERLRSPDPPPLPPLLLGRGRNDEWYTSEKLARDVDALEKAHARFEVIELDGGHEWSKTFLDRAGAFLRDRIA
jgi:predicted esterase